MSNIELHQLPEHKDKVCVRCGRGFPDTILNIEGTIHHGTKLLCINTQICKRAAKKLKKAKKGNK